MTLTVRPAEPEDMPAVYRLTHDEYVRKGYCKQQPDGLLNHYPHLDGMPETTVLLAEEDGRLVGTNSVTLDGRMRLHVDDDFACEVDRIRDECVSAGLVLGASWRIVTDHSARQRTQVLMALIGATVHHGAGLLDVILFSFHPGHATRYNRLLGLETIATGECLALSHKPPAVLMRGDAGVLVPHWQVTCRARKMPFDENILNKVKGG